MAWPTGSTGARQAGGWGEELPLPQVKDDSRQGNLPLSIFADVVIDCAAGSSLVHFWPRKNREGVRVGLWGALVVFCRSAFPSRHSYLYVIPDTRRSQDGGYRSCMPGAKRSGHDPLLETRPTKTQQAGGERQVKQVNYSVLFCRLVM